jgi:hypothetical protein
LTLSLGTLAALGFLAVVILLVAVRHLGGAPEEAAKKNDG